ncbi:DMT family transporter [Paracoccus sp. R86501]|uniref:DMT family transporter n=1 Tax=Paracoccus sp. R86501 TaxID=3101711 RepID=UPI00366C86F8
MMLVVLAALAGGVALAVQSSVNGRLGSEAGLVPTAWLTFFVGAVLCLGLVLFVEPAQTATLLDAPRWQLTGAFFGVVYIVVMVVAVPLLGIAAATVAVIAGQLSMSIVIDHFGWLGNEVMAIDASRAGAIALLLGALGLIYAGNRTVARKSA